MIDTASLNANELVDKLKSGAQITIDDLNLDKQLLDRINKFAPIKYILKNKINKDHEIIELLEDCLLYTSPSPRDLSTSRMPSSA